MTKSQFNIKISKDLLTRVKRQATMSGKSLTEHITDLVTKSLSESYLQSNDMHAHSEIMNFEDRLLNIESIVSNREYLSEKFLPFTNSEAINCTKFMRGLFEQELKKNKYKNKKEAFNDLNNHVKKYSCKSKNKLLERFESIILSEDPEGWTGAELNELAGGIKCNCPIRKGLINWTGKIDCPSQQEICDKGESLLPI